MNHVQLKSLNFYFQAFMSEIILIRILLTYTFVSRIVSTRFDLAIIVPYSFSRLFILLFKSYSEFL